jgi:hypothetical protein
MRLDTIARQHVQALEEATRGVPIPGPQLREPGRPLIALAVALAVVVAVGIAALTRVPDPDGARTAVTATSPSPADAVSVSTPVQWASFEMVFSASDGSYGRFLWVDPETWLVERFRQPTDGLAELVYSVSHRPDDVFVDDRDYLAADGDTEANSWTFVPDPALPYEELMLQSRIDEIVEAGSPTPPSHHLAVAAYESEWGTVELTDGGIAVSVVPADPASLSVQVTHLDVRRLGSAELTRQVGGSFPLIEYLTAATSKQQDVISQGFITEDEYLAAVQRAVDCLATRDPDSSVATLGEAREGPLEIVTESAAIDGCRAQELDAIETLWSYQTEVWDPSRIATISAVMADEQEMLGLLDAEPGPSVQFPDLELGFVSAHVRGPGVCSTVRIAGSSSTGCSPVSLWPVPGKFSLDVVYAAVSGELDQVAVSGFTPRDAAAVEVTFESGEVETLGVAQPNGEFPWAAFAGVFNGAETGFPTSIRLLDTTGSEVLSFDQRARVCGVDSTEDPDSPMVVRLCG